LNQAQENSQKGKEKDGRRQAQERRQGFFVPG
jgi:hypothetical protein